jgi:hypothetical protein
MWVINVTECGADILLDMGLHDPHANALTENADHSMDEANASVDHKTAKNAGGARSCTLL